MYLKKVDIFKLSIFGIKNNLYVCVSSVCVYGGLTRYYRQQGEEIKSKELDTQIILFYEKVTLE